MSEHSQSQNPAISKRETNTTEAKTVRPIPRKPISGFFLFNAENRAKVRAIHPGVSAAVVMKELSQMWRNLTKDEKDVYLKKSARIKQEYLDYMREHGLVGGKKRKFDQTTVVNTKNDKAIPRKPLSAYFIFNQEHRKKVRENNVGKAAPTVMKVLSQMWNALTDKEKRVYEEKAARMKQEYQDYMKKHGLTNEKKKKSKQTIDEMVRSLPTIEGYTNYNTVFGVTAVKRILSLNDEYNRSTGEANVLIVKATECFISWLAQSAFRANAVAKKKSLTKDSFYQALVREDRMEWLRESMPQPKNFKQLKSPKKSPQKRSKVSHVSNPKITSLFQSSS